MNSDANKDKQEKSIHDKRKQAYLISVIALMFIAIGAMVYLHQNMSTQKKENNASTQIEKKHEKARQQKPNHAKLAQVNYISSKNKSIDGSFSYNPDSEMPESTIRILGNEYPVVDSFNTEPPVKKFGVWQGIYDTTRHKQIYLAAHAGYGIGNLLFKVKIGDTIETSDINNHKRVYKVKYSRNLNDYGVSYDDGKDYYNETVNNPNEDRIVLQTCYNDVKNLLLYCYPVD